MLLCGFLLGHTSGGFGGHDGGYFTQQVWLHTRRNSICALALSFRSEQVLRFLPSNLTQSCFRTALPTPRFSYASSATQRTPHKTSQIGSFAILCKSLGRQDIQPRLGTLDYLLRYFSRYLS